ncbi:MAG: hypothetical protein M0Z30_02170 [Actinomycetota bacterium]|nr:hypothetical protein [Actinomycetota bacterium]
MTGLKKWMVGVAVAGTAAGGTAALASVPSAPHAQGLTTAGLAAQYEIPSTDPNAGPVNALIGEATQLQKTIGALEIQVADDSRAIASKGSGAGAVSPSSAGNPPPSNSSTPQSPGDAGLSGEKQQLDAEASALAEEQSGLTSEHDQLAAEQANLESAAQQLTAEEQQFAAEEAAARQSPATTPATAPHYDGGGDN